MSYPAGEGVSGPYSSLNAGLATLMAIHNIPFEMRIPLSISLAVITAFSSHAQAQDTAAATETRSPQAPPPSSAGKLPRSITHTTTDQGAHIYQVTGIYARSAERNPSYQEQLPDCTSFKLDPQNQTCTFTTSRELPLPELSRAFDQMAGGSGELPYWSELEARDTPPGALVGELRYSTTPATSEAPSGLAWFHMPREQPLRIPLGIRGRDPGTLWIVPSTAHCMSHSKYVLRILDEEGKLIWTDEKTLFADVNIAITDTVHEIWINRDDHGQKASFHITGTFQHPPEIIHDGRQIKFCCKSCSPTSTKTPPNTSPSSNKTPTHHKEPGHPPGCRFVTNLPPPTPCASATHQNYCVVS